MIQGFRIAATVLAFIIALTVLNTLGVSAVAGVHLDTGGVGANQAEEVVGDAGEPNVEGIGEQDPGVFGLATGLWKTFEQLWVLTTATNVILTSWGVPGIIAWGVQLMIDFTMAIAGWQIIRGMRFG